MDTGGVQDAPPEMLHLLFTSEQAPNPESRVTLADERDRLGQRRPVLDWRPGSSEDASVRRGARSFGLALGEAGLGRLRDRLPDEAICGLDLTGSFHHTGTTRMASDPSRGVVDADCRVHGISNLYVASSGVFPTHGAVNPTLTIMALAYRLADHLKGTSR
jgi:choline dehydrogenase-like flavoprotein